MRRNKNILKKAAVAAMVSTLAVTTIPFSAFGYGEKTVNGSESKAADNTVEFQSWRDNEWWGTGKASANSGNIALTPGATESDLNFAWYSEQKGIPAVKVWKDGQKAAAKVITGTADSISAENWQGSKYAASNKVCIKDYFEAENTYYYQYTDDYNDNAVWSAEYTYKTSSSDSFSVILTGDPQIGASGSSTDYSDKDDSTARDTYGWNKTMTAAMVKSPNAAFLLSAGDQINQSGAAKIEDLKTRESEYAGYFYPSVFRSLPVASTIGNHDTAGADYTAHFNNPNSSDELGKTAAGSDYYFSYGDVLFISLNSNNRNQEEHRTLMNKAVASNPDAKWKVVIFHSDIYGSGQPHADTDAATNRIVLAPLMDEFDIDICLTGHDHTYSRSYQILDGNVIDYDISSGSVTNPEGTLYVTTGSGSGSKYYNLLKYTPYYIAERTNDTLPAFSTIDFSQDSLVLKNYDYNGNPYADTFTIKKTSDAASTDEVIADAEAKLADTAVSYTEDSLNTLKTSLETLKNMKAAYTTAEDAMAADITNNYGTANDRISGYGSIKNAEDKDGKANRLKQGESTLLDKTIYTQIQNGEQVEGYESKVPVVSAESLENAKSAVVSAIASLSVKTVEPAVTPDTDNTNTSDGSDSPNTGDNMAKAFGCASVMIVSLGTALVVYRKKEEENC